MLPACCARCGKRFQNKTRVLLHMNQPLSFCRIQFEDQLKRSRRRQKRHLEQHSATEPDTTTSSSTAETSSGFEYQDSYWNLNTPDADGGTGVGPTSDSTEPYPAELYPGAAQTYGHGQTFMDRFNADEFSCYRDNLPYYPFASQDEWELAAFLLRSDLSMSALDEFFKLATVTYCHTV